MTVKQHALLTVLEHSACLRSILETACDATDNQLEGVRERQKGSEGERDRDGERQR